MKRKRYAIAVYDDGWHEVIQVLGIGALRTAVRALLSRGYDTVSIHVECLTGKARRNRAIIAECRKILRRFSEAAPLLLK